MLSLRPAQAALLLLTLVPGSAVAEAEKEPKDPWDYRLFRFEFDNDSFIGSDDVFSAGWSFQFHSRLTDQWSPAYAGWIGKLPGLGDDGEGGRVVRWAYGLSQIILTPTDISIEAPQPDDVPWAGSLGLTGSWWSNDNRKLAAIQIYLGCMGPCSYAEQVQKFVHEDLGFGESPKGWDNQLSNQALANLNYEYRHKLYADEVPAYVPGRFASDLSIGGQAALGNLTTFLQGQIEFRFGWGLPMGFTKIPDPPGIGTMMEPVYFDPTQPLIDLYRWRIYFNLVARSTLTTYLAPAEGGPTESGYDHPAIDSYPGEQQGLLGLHLVRVPFGMHLTYYRYFGSEPSPVLACRFRGPTSAQRLCDGALITRDPLPSPMARRKAARSPSASDGSAPSVSSPQEVDRLATVERGLLARATNPRRPAFSG